MLMIDGRSDVGYSDLGGDGTGGFARIFAHGGGAVTVQANAGLDASGISTDLFGASTTVAAPALGGEATRATGDSDSAIAGGPITITGALVARADGRAGTTAPGAGGPRRAGPPR